MAVDIFYEIRDHSFKKCFTWTEYIGCDECREGQIRSGGSVQRQI